MCLRQDSACLMLSYYCRSTIYFCGRLTTNKLIEPALPEVMDEIPQFWNVVKCARTTCRSGPTAPCVVSWMPLVSPSMFLPTFRFVRRAETNDARTFTGTGIVAARHKDRIKGC